MKTKLRAAFIAASHGFSPDRVVADPALNQRFLEECRSLELADPPAALNWQLLNARKQGLLSGLPRAKQTSFPNEEEYRFASEVAARFLEQRYGTSLDRVLCDPTWAAEFDGIAADIALGYTPLQYRWAALNLRKCRSLRPELLSRVIAAETIQLGRMDQLKPADIPMQQGIYVIYGPKEALYVGEATNLRKRIEKHSDHSDNKGLARWLWEHGATDIRLEVRALPENTATRVRRALEAELIASRRPVFNIQRP